MISGFPVRIGPCRKLSEAFEGTYECAAHHYLGCQIELNRMADTSSVSAKCYTEEVLRAFNRWEDPVPCPAPMPPNTRLSIDDYNIRRSKSKTPLSDQARYMFCT